MISKLDSTEHSSTRLNPSPRCQSHQRFLCFGFWWYQKLSSWGWDTTTLVAATTFRLGQKTLLWTNMNPRYTNNEELDKRTWFPRVPKLWKETMTVNSSTDNAYVSGPHIRILTSKLIHVIPWIEGIFLTVLFSQLIFLRKWDASGWHWLSQWK